MNYRIISCGIMLTMTAFANDQQTINLDQALSVSRTNSSMLRAAVLDTQAASTAVDAAGRWKNPELKFSAEGLGIDLEPYGEAEYMLGLSQEFQRGRKQQFERMAAHQSVRMAEYVNMERVRELEARVRLAYFELFAQQEIGSIRAEQLELSRAFLEVARRRLNAGAGSELEVAQAELSYEETVLSQTCCFGDLAAAQAQLASLLGLPVENLPALEGPFYEVETMEQYRVDKSHPTLLRLDAELERTLAQARRAQAADVSDITLGAGYRHDAAADIDSLVISASMPLSFNKRGRAEHAAGLWRVEAMRAGREDVRRQLQLEVDRLLALHKGAVMEAQIISDHLLPKVREAYALSRQGYEAGRYSWLELIASQQHLAEVRIRQVDALLAVHRIEAELSKYRKDLK